MPKKIEFMVTLWPSFEHFSDFANDSRITGIRLNSAMINNPELEIEVQRLEQKPPKLPMYFDAKGRQPRIEQVIQCEDHLELVMNHPLVLQTPTEILFKGEVDRANVVKVCENGRRLILEKYRPYWRVFPGESIHVLQKNFFICGPTFTAIEKSKLEITRRAGFNNYFLSYVESQRDIDEFRELVGSTAKIMLKIETLKGLQFVSDKFKKTDDTVLVAARGDLFVEIQNPHIMPQALRLIIDKDPEACVASRLLLSIMDEQLKYIHLVAKKTPNEQFDLDIFIEKIKNIKPGKPSCADICELAWLTDIGYRSFMLCDELCLKRDLLGAAVDEFNAFIKLCRD